MVANQLNIKKHFIKIRFESNDDLPLGKILSFSSMIIVTRSVCQTNIIHKSIYINVCMNLGRNYKNCYNMEELIFQKKSLLINEVSQKKLQFVIISISKILDHISVISVMIYQLWFL